MSRQHHFVTHKTISNNDLWLSWFRLLQQIVKLYPVARKLEFRVST
jgi:hypothetical protein